MAKTRVPDVTARWSKAGKCGSVPGGDQWLSPVDVRDPLKEMKERAPAGGGVRVALRPTDIGYPTPMRGTTSINEIRTAIRELSVRAELAHKERPA